MTYFTLNEVEIKFWRVGTMLNRSKIGFPSRIRCMKLRSCRWSWGGLCARHWLVVQPKAAVCAGRSRVNVRVIRRVWLRSRVLGWVLLLGCGDSVWAEGYLVGLSGFGLRMGWTIRASFQILGRRFLCRFLVAVSGRDWWVRLRHLGRGYSTRLGWFLVRVQVRISGRDSSFSPD